MNPNNVFYLFLASGTYRNDNEINKERVDVDEIEIKIYEIEYDRIAFNIEFGLLLAQ